ncbi:MAG TPA: hypothetical protein VIX73_05555, partial [Kofleriaceae bacterium]
MTAGLGAMAMVAVAAVGCSGAQPRTVGCSKDTDCKDPRVCEHNVCVDPRPPGDAAVALVAIDAATVVAGPPAAMFGGDAHHTGRRGSTHT